MEASTVLTKLRSLGHEYGPDKQVYKAQLGDTKVTVFDRRGHEKPVHARDLEHHIDHGGMYLTAEDAYAANPSTEEAQAAASPVARSRR